MFDKTYNKMRSLTGKALKKERRDALSERDLWRDLIGARLLLVPVVIAGGWMIWPGIGMLASLVTGMGVVGAVGTHILGRIDLHCVDKVRKERRTAAAAALAAAAETAQRLRQIESLSRDFHTGSEKPVAVMTLRLKSAAAAPAPA